jgi:hypothetical protein
MESQEKMMTGEESLRIITGYLIPGYMLKNKADHDKV